MEIPLAHKYFQYNGGQMFFLTEPVLEGNGH